jgi:adenine phosphoribosyltransferase
LAVDELRKKLDGIEFDTVAGLDARGFLIAAPVAYAEKKGLVLIRKKGKLPRETISENYALEYGTAEVELHTDSVKPGERVVIIDDLIATGGTLEAAVELEGLNGREKLKGYDVETLISYSGK